MAHHAETMFEDRNLLPIADKVHAGERLTRKDGIALATSADLLGVGRLANTVRERLHGNETYYNINRHLNPTNVCVASCALCAYAVPYARAGEGWTYTIEEALRIAARDISESVSELHIVGGLHPKLDVAYYEALFAALKKRFPWIHIKALTMVELDFVASVSRISIDELIQRVAKAGLDSCPGGGAEIFAPRVRDIICDHKTDGQRWLDVARTVHRHGITTNCTMLYGHVERPSERVDHLIALRELQDETHGFQCFVPLSFHPANTKLAHLPRCGGVLDLQTIALARLMLDNIPHIKAYWIMLGEKIAQVAQHFGADDIDGTVIDERVTYAAGGAAGKGMPVSRIEFLIREAGRTPVLRDTLYRPLERPAAPASAAV